LASANENFYVTRAIEFLSEGKLIKAGQMIVLAHEAAQNGPKENKG
jgi:hypothetical protein